MFAGYHYTLNPKKPGYDGLWGTHPEFGLMRGTENIIGTVRSPRPVMSMRLVSIARGRG